MNRYHIVQVSVRLFVPNRMDLVMFLLVASLYVG